MMEHVSPWRGDRCQCQNCEWEGDEADTNPVEDIFERVSPGEPMPSGECPKCGALCQPCEPVEIPAADADDVDALTYDYHKDGVQLRRQLAKSVLSNTGTWADVVFLHQDRNLMADDEWKPAKITIVRFKRVMGIWKKQSHLNINGRQRSDQIAALLFVWREKLAP